jgi:ABC-type multidrug transport system permease subunit
MLATWALAKKELRLLLRDPRAAVLLLGMPLLFIFLLGLLLGEGFGQNPDRNLRVSVVDLDRGHDLEQAIAWLALTPAPVPLPDAVSPQILIAASLDLAHHGGRFPPGKWSDIVLRDLQETAGIRVEIIGDLQTAEYLCRESKRPAVLKLGPNFSRRLAACSFLSDGINPFYRDGIRLNELDADLIRDKTQKMGASVIEQIAQVTLLRVVLPWMIGKVFEKLSEEEFVERLGDQVRLPIPLGTGWLFQLKGIQLVDDRATLNGMLRVASPDRRTEEMYHEKVGEGVQSALSQQFSKYNLTGKTWAALTRSGPPSGNPAEVAVYQADDARYQFLVPSYTVMFAFALTLVVGWLFVTERRRGTLKRLLAAPLRSSQVLLGKFLPSLALAVFQACFLLTAGKLLFQMHWGPDSWSISRQVLWLFPVVLATSLAAMGLAMLVAALARTEMQVAIYGSLLVLALGLIGGCVVPRELMSRQAQQISLVTPQAWALDAYRQLLLSPDPNLGIVTQSCLVLTAFGAGFLVLAWGSLKLEESH